MHMQLAVRFGYGARVPWIDRQEDDTLRIIAGADQVVLRGAAPVSVADNCIESDFVVAAGETVAFTLTYAASHLVPPDPIDPHEAFADDQALLGGMGGQGERRARRAAPRHHALADHAQGADLRADRRHRRGADHQPARDAGRHPQLGLPILLAARRDAVAARPDERRLLRGGGGVARLAAARRRRRAAAGADHVQHHRREPADRMGGRLAAGLRGRAAGAHRQRRPRPAPARRLWRGHGRALPGEPRRHRRQRGRLEPDAGLPVAPDDDLARARSRHLGKPCAAAPFHLQQDHGLGRLRPRRQVRPRLRPEGAGRALERGGARDPRRRLPPRASTPSWEASCSPTARSGSTAACC